METIEDATLALCQLHRMDNATQRGRCLDQRTDTKSAQDAFGGQTFFGDRRVVGKSLTVEALQEVVSRQRDLKQVDERLDAFGRFEEQGPDCQRRLPLMMALFDVALLLERGEEHVSTLRQWCGREQCGIAVVVGVGPSSRVIVVEDKAVRWPATTTRGGRQTGLLINAE